MATNVGQLVISLGANTQAFSLEMTRAQQMAAKTGQEVTGTLNKLSSASVDWGKKTKEAGDHALSGQQAASAAIRTVGGNIEHNMRAAEKFISMIPGMTNLLKAAFPVMGGLAMIGVLDEIWQHGHKVYDFFEHMRNAPQYIAESFRQISAPLRATNDEIQISNDKLQMELDKLNGKPNNGLKLAIDEAIRSADMLAASLAKDNEELGKLLKENQVGIWARIFGNAGTSDITKSFGGDNGLGGFRQAINDVTARGTEAIRNATTATEKDNAARAMQISLAKEYGKQIDWVKGKLKDANDAQSKHYVGMDLDKHTRFYTSDSRQGKYVNPEWRDESQRIAILQQSLTQLELEASHISLGVQGEDLSKKVNQRKAEVSALKDNPYRTKMAELDARLADARANAKAEPSNPVSGARMRAGGQTDKDIIEINTKLAETKRSLTAAEKDNILATNTQIELTKLSDSEGKKYVAVVKEMRDAAAKLQVDLDDSNARAAQRLKAIQDETDEINLMADAYSKGADAVLEARIKIALAKMGNASQAEKDAKANLMRADDNAQTGNVLTNLKRQTAATVELTKAQGKGLQARRDAEKRNIENSGEGSDVIEAKKAALQAQYDAEDKANFKGQYGSASEGMRSYFEEMTDNAKSAGAMVHETLGSAFQGLDDQLAKLVTGQKTSFASLFQGIAEQIAKMGISNLLGKIGSSLFGGAGGGAGGAMGGILKGLFGGFKASGGDVDPAKGYIVGENGPEWFNPPTKGNIVPNHKLGGGGAYYSIDARGANEADVEMRVQRALAQVHGSAVRSAMAAQTEARARRSRSKF